ncbi:MAG: hypothetical protein K0S42_314 [Microvirga sp.]|nr:hypothetical protein [Microvirga sp.]
MPRDRFRWQRLRVPGLGPRPALLLLLTLRLLFLGFYSEGQRQREKQGGIKRKAQLTGHRNILMAALKLEALPPAASAGAMKTSCSQLADQPQTSS